MGVEFRPADPDRDEDVAALVRWANDPAIRHLHVRCEDEADYRRPETPESTRQALIRAVERGVLAWMIEDDGRLVGEVSVAIDAPPLHDRTPGSAWLSLCVGEASARGRGIGGAAMARVEAVLRERACPRVEVGVFEFNAPARRLYARCGYVEIARLPEFTWWDGRLWTDLRLEKRLAPVESGSGTR